MDNAACQMIPMINNRLTFKALLTQKEILLNI